MKKRNKIIFGILIILVLFIVIMPRVIGGVACGVIPIQIDLKCPSDMKIIEASYHVGWNEDHIDVLKVMLSEVNNNFKEVGLKNTLKPNNQMEAAVGFCDRYSNFFGYEYNVRKMKERDILVVIKDDKNQIHCKTFLFIRGKDNYELTFP